MAKKPPPRDSLFVKLFSQLPVKVPGVQQEPEAAEKKTETPELTLLFFIIDWEQTKVISSVFEEEKVRFHYIMRGRGTANSEMLHLLGIDSADKAVIICMEQLVMIPVLIKEVRKKLSAHNASGIAFNVPFSAINSPILRVFKQSIHKNEKLAEEQNTSPPKPQGHSHSLLISVINQGYSNDFMNTAREAGASGGTVINVRGQPHEGTVKFFGISVQKERELIIMLTNEEKKDSIMQAIYEEHGLGSKAQGIIFSLPVERVMSLSLV